MSQNHTGNVTPSIDNEEHDHLLGKVAVKKSGQYIWKDDDWQRQSEVATETTLDLIKDTDGIKKITDPVTTKLQYFFYASADDATYDYVVKEDKDTNWYVMRVNKSTGLAEYATSAIQDPALSPDTAANALTNKATLDYTTPGGAF